MVDIRATLIEANVHPELSAHQMERISLTLVKANEMPTNSSEVSNNALSQRICYTSATYKSERGPSIIHKSHRHEIALLFGKYHETTKKQSLTVWYHIKPMKPGEPTTTLSRMKFLLSHVATANAGTYSDLHQLVMQEFERNHPMSGNTPTQDASMLNPKGPAESAEDMMEKPEWKT